MRTKFTMGMHCLLMPYFGEWDILDVEWDDNGDILAKTMLSHRIEED